MTELLEIWVCLDLSVLLALFDELLVRSVSKDLFLLGQKLIHVAALQLIVLILEHLLRFDDILVAN